MTDAAHQPGDTPTGSAAPLRLLRADALTPLSQFEDACAAVLDHLAGALSLETWLVSRAVGDDWVVLASIDRSRQLEPGSGYRWSDTVCARMVSGRGPRSAPRTADVASYAMAPVARDLPIEAYVGAEIVGPSGVLFGTLCGLHPEPLEDHQLASVVELVVLQARLLAGVLAATQRAFDAGRQDERLTRSIQADPMTGLLNRAGWDDLLRAEDRRAAILGLPTGVLVIELAGLREVTARSDLGYGERTLRDVADVLRGSTRRSDTVARTGETDFAVLLPDTGPLHVDQVASRIRDGFARRNIRAWVGSAMRDPRRDLAAAVNRAATARFLDKRR